MTQTAVGYARGGTDDQDHAARRRALTKLDAAGEHSISERAEVFSVSRPRANRVAAIQES
jgi:hypothetical protein